MLLKQVEESPLEKKVPNAMTTKYKMTFSLFRYLKYRH